MYASPQRASAEFGLLPSIVNALPTLVGKPDGVEVPPVMLTEVFTRSNQPEADLRDQLTKGAVELRILEPPVAGGVTTAQVDLEVSQVELTADERSFTVLYEQTTTWYDHRLVWDGRWALPVLQFPTVGSGELYRLNSAPTSVFFPLVAASPYLEDKLIERTLFAANDGRVTLTEVKKSTFTCELVFSDFPSDTQECSFALVAQTAGVSLSGNQSFTSSLSGFGTAYWTTGVDGASGVVATFSARRRASPFLIATIVPSILLVLTVTLLFWVPPTVLPPRLQVCVLVLVVLQQLRTAALKPLPLDADMTWMDFWILYNTMYVVLLFSCFATNWDGALAENCISALPAGK